VIYFIQAGARGDVKIGYAKTHAAVDRRRATFQTGHSETLQILGVVEGEREDEATLHRYFAPDRVRGEWFRPTGALMACASDIEQARRCLDFATSWRRWHDLGLVDASGRLTDDGMYYAMALEQTLASDGIDLDQWFDVPST
jgi:hypothetical protein